MKDRIAHLPEPVRSQRCETCKHFAGEVFGRMPPTCRINPPVLVPAPGPQGQLGFVGMWAPTESAYWCDKWAAKVSSSN